LVEHFHGKEGVSGSSPLLGFATLSMYLGDPPERSDVPVSGLVHVGAGTPVQTANEPAV
jgi:hypothetical protein